MKRLEVHWTVAPCVIKQRNRHRCRGLWKQAGTSHSPPIMGFS
jgi:hypothetical protein